MAATPEMKAIVPILEACTDPVIYDLGAHEGWDSDWMVRACKTPPVLVMVEPDDGHFRMLSDLAPKLPTKWYGLYHAAISDQTGRVTFYECHTPEGRGSGSIRRPTGHVERNGIRYDFTPKEVDCITLDRIFIGVRNFVNIGVDVLFGHAQRIEDRGPDHIDLLWVDIQAAERDMIAGGQEALKNTRYMFIEAEDGAEMYEGQFMRKDLLNILPGWRVIGDFDFNLLLVNDGYQK